MTSEYFELRAGVELDFTLALMDAAIRNENNLLAEVGVWFREEWVMDPLYHDVVEAVFAITRANKPLSNSTIAKALAGKAKKYQCSPQTVANLFLNAFGWFHLRYYGKQVYDEYRRSAVASDAEGTVSELRLGSSVTEAIEDLSLLPEKYQELEMNRVDRGDAAIQEIISEMEGVATPHFKLGVASIDSITKGFRNGSLVTVAAPTGSGKSVMLAQAAITRVTRDGRHALYFSAEMTLRELTERWAAFICQATPNDRRVYVGGLCEVQKLIGRSAKVSLQVFEGPRHVDNIVATVRAYAATHTLGLVCVDYVQMYIGGQPKDTRERQIADITGKLKMLAMECHIPILVASQFNRSFQGTPTINNLRDSGSIAQDSDVVLLIDTDLKNRDDIVKADVVVAKNRHGTVGTANVEWNKPLFMFVDPAPERWPELE